MWDEDYRFTAPYESPFERELRRVIVYYEILRNDPYNDTTANFEMHKTAIARNLNYLINRVNNAKTSEDLK